MSEKRSYIAIDLKSFYASVECVERGLDPLTANLVVADESRTEKTICLAVSPSLKAYGISGRARLFEVVERIKQINRTRLKDPVTYITAKPRMQLYMDYSTRIYGIYLKYVAPEDMHVYSVDEVFLDVTHYLNTYKMTPHELAMTMVRDVLKETGITATAGIGTNMYLAKIAMDIVAKHIPADEDGVRIAELDEISYRKRLWNHRPLTDFWRVGRGIAGKLEETGIHTMGDVARCSLGRQDEYYNENLLFDMFGVNAELLIDHAWGWEPCTIDEIRAYRPKTNSLGSGQVLQEPYTHEKAAIVVWEMADLLVLDLVDKRLTTDQLVLDIGYDIENIADPERKAAYHGKIEKDHYGRLVPKPSHGSINLDFHTSSSHKILEAVTTLFEEITDPKLLIRRITVTANHVITEDEAAKEKKYVQLDMFTDYEALEQKENEEKEKLEREKRMQKAVLEIKKRFGKNAVLKGTNLVDGATARDRNAQIGGHKA